jgi:prepilin-type N-terminal cleavage/methylation domain-containing protein
VTSARHDHGFTIVELLVTMAMALVVFGATLSVLELFQRHNVYAQRRNENQDNARNAMDRIARSLRDVIAPGSEFAGALETAEEYSTMFQTVDTSAGEFGATNKTHAMRVRYCLYDKEPGNELLLEQTQRSKEKALASAPASACMPGASGWTTTTLVEHVTNRAGGQKRPLFTYSASEAPQVVSVEINLYLELAPGQRPGETELMSGVSLRNANRKPVAKFKANFFAGKNEHEQVVLNASESEDPDGLALTYKWWENGAQLSSTSQIFTVKLCNGECEHKLTFHFKLEVVNPGGLTEHAEETVET